MKDKRCSEFSRYSHVTIQALLFTTVFRESSLHNLVLTTTLLYFCD